MIVLIFQFSFIILHFSFIILYYRRAGVRRGEHSGRLRQIIINGQLQPTDVLVGRLNMIDDFRGRLTDEIEGK